jgi:ADP-ribose pyrophosphatase
MAQRDHRGMTTVCAPVFRLERLNLTVPLHRIGQALGDGNERLTVHRVPLAELRRFAAARQDAGVQIDIKLWAGLFLADLSDL